MTPETTEATPSTPEAHARPVPYAGTLLVAAALACGVAVGCDPKNERTDASASKPAVVESASNVAGTPASADAVTGDAAARRAIAPPPEPLPPRADLAHEVPAITAELQSNPAYVGLFEPARREDLDVVLTGLSAALAEASVGKRVIDEIKERKLDKIIEGLMRVHMRTGKLPDEFATKLRAHIEATSQEDHRGLWLPATAKQVRDYTALAVHLDPNDATLVRELLAARKESWVHWNRAKSPKRPWLAIEAGAIARLEQLDDLTAAEQARLELLGLPALPDDATCSTVAKLFGPESKKSSVQMEQLWLEYKGKRFSWRLKITDVSSAAIGSGYSVQAKCLGSESLIQDVQLEYGDAAKDFVLGLDRDTVHELDGVLSAYSQALGLVAEGHP